MNMLQFEIMLIAVLVALASALPGTFLVLRGVALMSDAISHAILLGIAVMFLIVQRLDSIWLIIGASLSGLLTVFFTEVLINTKRLKKDAAIGLVFPLFFSCGIIIISQYARNVHLDVDMVILGELAFASFNRFIFYGYNLGPVALWTIGGILLLNILFIGLLYKELMLATFDSELAHTSGFNPILIHYGLMAITSITAVGAFDIVGSIVVVALMITPPATAFLLTQRLNTMLMLSILIGSCAAISGCYVAHLFDVSIAGSIATMCGIIFVMVLLVSPRNGLIANIIYSNKQREHILLESLCRYLTKINPKHTQTIATLGHDLGLSNKQIKKLVAVATSNKLVQYQNNMVRLLQ